MNALSTSVTKVSVSTSLLLLGVQDYYDTYEAITSHRHFLNIKEFNQYHDAYEWLDSTVENDQPFVVICSYEFLAQDGFRFLREFRKLDFLQSVPFFLLKPEQTKVNAHALLQMGVSDCFSIPIDWSFLCNRISFHHKMTNAATSLQSTPAELNILQAQTPIIKRIFDICFASIMLLTLSPLLILIAIAIKIESRGPIIYCSRRAGKGYKIFNFYKFRSMYQDADKRLSELQHLNQYAGEQDNCFLKFKNDPRITKVGRIIRKTSLDELPQLFNVLKGDMSVVGNRPLPLYEAKLLVRNDWAQRFMAPAGLTGLWQVTKRGKNDMSTEERVQLDITYAQKHSFWYDLGILVRTLPAMVQHEDV